MAEVKIGIAQPSDLDGINYVRLQIFNDPKSPLEPFQFNDRSYIEKNDKRITFFAKKDGKIVGYVSLGLSKSLLDPDETDLEMYVLPDSQCQGIGTKLLGHSEKYVTDSTTITRLVLFVRDDNPRLEFFTKNHYCIREKPPRGYILDKTIKR